MKLNSKFATSFWDSLSLFKVKDDGIEHLSNCYLFGNIVFIKTKDKNDKICYLKKDLIDGRISEAEHDMFVDYFATDYTDTYGVEYNPDSNVCDTYWLRAGKHTKPKKTDIILKTNHIK